MYLDAFIFYFIYFHLSGFTIHVPPQVGPGEFFLHRIILGAQLGKIPNVSGVIEKLVIITFQFGYLLQVLTR